MLFRCKGLLLSALASFQAILTGLADPPVEMLFRNWNSLDGLPQDHVRVILRSRDGFLWLGTDAGLARFDGIHFKTYGKRDGLGAITVLNLLEAKDGSLWIGTLDGGVSVMRNGRIERSFTREDGLPAAVAPAMAEDSEGRIWVAGSVRLEGDRFIPIDGADQPARIIFKDREGVLWMSRADTSIARWKAGKWSQGSGGGPTSADAYCEDAAGRLWIADSSRQLWCRDGSEWKAWPLPQGLANRASSLTVAADGTVWIALYRAGICGFRDGVFFEIRTGQDDFLDLTEKIYAAPDGLLWMGSSTNGLYSLVPRRIQMADLKIGKSGLGSNFIGALVEASPGSFVVGTQGQGLYRWREEKTEAIHKFSTFNQGLFVNVLLKDRKGVVWAGTGEGLYGLLPDENGLLRPVQPGMLNEIWDLCEDRNEGIWIGRGNGDLFHFASAVRKVDYGGTGEGIKGLAQTPDGALWIGTRGYGLYRLMDGQSRRIGVADGLGSEVIRVLHVGEDGALWAGTAGGGLSLWRDGSFLSFTVSDGLPNDVISQISEDAAGRLWLGTNRGLAVIEESELQSLKLGQRLKLHPLLINRGDGLVSEECTIVPPIRMADGRMAFATTQGFAMLDPKDFSSAPITPPVFIESVSANGRPVTPVDGKLHLKPGLERLAIEFTGLHFKAPKRLLFRNRLKGIEQEWGTPGSQRSVEYRALAPGSYRFELSGSIGNGLWSPKPATLDIIVAPFFWQTLWFKIGSASLALGGVAMWVRRRERLRALRKIESLKKNQAIQEERARIARDLHDDVGASLTQVALLSELAASDLADRPGDARVHINEIFDTAKNVTRSLDEIVWAVNPTQDTLERFAAFLGTFVQGYTRTAGLTARIEMPAELPQVAVTSPIRHHLYLATKEVLHNVVKHASASEIRLCLMAEPSGIRLMIEDNGQGLGDVSRNDGDGLENLRKRMHQIGGTCIHRDARGSGTLVELFAPLGGG